MGHPQPVTPMQVDNSTANGILTGTVKQQRSRAMDMRFYWMKDRTQQGQFNVFWAPGRDNLAATSPSIIRQLIIASCARNIYMNQNLYILESSEGVLNPRLKPK
jgi:hypothetical protein